MQSFNIEHYVKMKKKNSQKLRIGLTKTVHGYSIDCPLQNIYSSVDWISKMSTSVVRVYLKRFP